jgi:LmbE family N-acetylglucosaminyl deacetylase
MKIFCLSPHFDDAFLSAFGLLSSFGREVTIVYPFESRGGLANNPRWRFEEQPNLDLCGCSAEFLGIPEPDIKGQDGFVVRAALPTDSQACGNLIGKLAVLLESERPDLLVAPLGIGRHYHHLLCTVAALSVTTYLKPPVPGLLLYSDIPYCVAVSLLRGGPLQLFPENWLSPIVVAVNRDLKLKALLRYKSQFRRGVVARLLDHCSQEAVTMENPLSRGEAPYECYWSPLTEPADLVSLAAAQAPQCLQELQYNLLPAPQDETPYFSRKFQRIERVWSAALKEYAREFQASVLQAERLKLMGKS